MTQEVLKNIDTVKKALADHGFGHGYDNVIENGIVKGLKEIPLEPLTKKYGENEWLYLEPRVAEGAKGRHYFNGFQASLAIGDELIATNYYGNYRMAGMNIEQARLHLHGATVLHREYLDSRQAITPVYSRIQFPLPQEGESTGQEQQRQMRKGEKLPNIMVPADSVDFAKLISTEDINLYPARKEKAIQDLQEGKVVEVTITERELGKKPVDRKVFMELSLESKEIMSLILHTPEGQFLRKNDIPVTYVNALSEGQVIGKGEAMPEKISNLFNSIAQGNRPEDARTQRQPSFRFRQGGASSGDATVTAESKGDSHQLGAGKEKIQGEGQEKGTEKANQVRETVNNGRPHRRPNGIN